MDIQEAIALVVTGRNLSQEEAYRVIGQVMSGQASDAQIGALITALRMKGETVDEIAGAAAAMREKATRVRAPEGLLVDTCGTGGDSSGTFNISTTCAFVVAAAGVTVAKHGNRSISSKSGSADVLKALGVNIDAEPPVVEACMREAGIGFLFAPRHHGAMRFAMGPRKEVGIRTIFNLLGPLTNPASAPNQLLGVFDGAWTEPLAAVLGRLGSRRAMVVHGEDGLDEITITGPTQVAELLEDGTVETDTIHPEELGFALAQSSELKGGDAAQNAAITRAILDGSDSSAKRDVVLLNAGAALYISGKSPDLTFGVEAARKALASGEAMARLAKLVEVSNA